MKFIVVCAAVLALFIQPALATTYNADRHGRFFVSVLINDVPLSLQVDTGADAVTLTARDAKAAGISKSDVIRASSMTTASGDTVQTVVVRLKELRIGRTSVANMSALVLLSEQADTSLLGMEALSRLGSIHINGRTLTIDDEATPPQAPQIQVQRQIPKREDREQLVAELLNQCEGAASCHCAATKLAASLSDEQLAFAVAHDWSDEDMGDPSPQKAALVRQAKSALQSCGALKR